MKKLITFILLMFTISINSQPTTTQIFDGNGLSQVTSLNTLPTGEMLVTEKRGIISKVEETSDQTIVTELIDIRDRVYSVANEQGLQDLLIDSNNPNIWIIAYSAKLSFLIPGQQDGMGSYSITSRIEYNPNDGSFLEDIILRVPILNANHDGKSLNFDDTGALLVSTGDGASGQYIPFLESIGFIPTEVYASNRLRSLQIETLVGKTLRINPLTGEGLPDNPYWNGDAFSTESKIWTVGHRNPAFGCYYNGALYVGNTLGFLPQSIERIDRGGVGFGYPYREGFEDTSPGEDLNYPGTTIPFSNFYLGPPNDWDVSLDPNIGRWQAKLPILTYDRVNFGNEIRFKNYDIPSPYYTTSSLNYNGQFGGGMGFITTNAYGEDLEGRLLISDFFRNDMLAIKLDPLNNERVIDIDIIDTGQFQLTDITENPITDEIYMSFYGGEIRKLNKSTLSNNNYILENNSIMYYTKYNILKVSEPSEIFDMLGKKIMDFNGINHLNLSSGIYIVKNSKETKKIIL